MQETSRKSAYKLLLVEDNPKVHEDLKRAVAEYRELGSAQGSVELLPTPVVSEPTDVFGILSVMDGLDESDLFLMLDIELHKSISVESISQCAEGARRSSFARLCEDVRVVAGEIGTHLNKIHLHPVSWAIARYRLQRDCLGNTFVIIVSSATDTTGLHEIWRTILLPGTTKPIAGEDYISDPDAGIAVTTRHIKDYPISSFINTYRSSIHNEDVSGLACEQWSEARAMIAKDLSSTLPESYIGERLRRIAKIHNCYWAHHIDGGGATSKNWNPTRNVDHLKVLEEVAKKFNRLLNDHFGTSTDLGSVHDCKWIDENGNRCELPWRAFVQFNGKGRDLENAVESKFEELKDKVRGVVFEHSFLVLESDAGTNSEEGATASALSIEGDARREYNENSLWFNAPMLLKAIEAVSRSLSDEEGWIRRIFSVESILHVDSQSRNRFLPGDNNVYPVYYTKYVITVREYGISSSLAGEEKKKIELPVPDVATGTPKDAVDLIRKAGGDITEKDGAWSICFYGRSEVIDLSRFAYIVYKP